MERFSRRSLEQLKGTAPGAYEGQRRRLEGSVISGEILGEFLDPDERMKYFKVIVDKTKDIIFPSLGFFFDNLQYLESVTDCIKQLVPRSKGLINIALRNAYRDNSEKEETCWIQTGALSIEKFARNNHNFELAVRQLWIWAFREHVSMPRAKAPRKATASRDPTNKFLLHEFAQMADRCGIKTDAVRKLLEIDPYFATALQFVELLLPSGWEYEKPEEAAELAKALAPSLKEARLKAMTLPAVSLAERHAGAPGGRAPAVSGKPHFLDALRD
ncbi:hypothetical protein K4F52_010349, partial [Lecanicillium sp. MT-2017a]